METSYPQDILEQLTSDLQWGHRLSAMETSPGTRAGAGAACSFNGATAFRRWKLMERLASLPIGRCLQWGHRLSAMETENPIGKLSTVFRLQWGHRLSAMETIGSWSAQPACASFNGATAFRRWKLAVKERWEAEEARLQWGHRLSAMETRIQLCAKHLLLVPSMGPPPFGDGNPARRLPPLVLAFPSMGPPPFGDGNSDYVSDATLNNASFNGATAFRRWKRPVSFWAACPVSNLQWGHRLSAMETPVLVLVE